MLYSKRLIIFWLLFVLSSNSVAQSPAYADITGLWKGTMYNDTTKLFYRYEIAISENKGKLSGYSHTYFIIDNKEYHGLKKIKITRNGNEVITQDLELIANNYPIKPPKGVHVINVLKFEIKNNVMVLSGHFETNRTKEYAPATGFIQVERKNNYSQSALIPHLQELGLAKNLSFIDDVIKQETTVATASIQVEKKQEPVIDTVAKMPKQEKVEAPIVAKKESAAETTTSKPKVDVNPVSTKTPPKTETAAVVTAKNETEKKQPVVKKQVAPVVVKAKPAEVEKTATTKVENTSADKPKTIETVKTPAITEKETKPVFVNNLNVSGAAIDVNNRKVETIEAVYYKSDSLDLTLYDNGEVDGDTVSVLMNGQVIMPKVGLSTNAVHKKISTVNTGDSIQIIMYAENLGRLPPNTGLLIVYDGSDRYEIRFSGDMKKSSAIVFKRKEN